MEADPDGSYQQFVEGVVRDSNRKTVGYNTHHSGPGNRGTPFDTTLQPKKGKHCTPGMAEHPLPASSAALTSSHHFGPAAAISKSKCAANSTKDCVPGED